MTYKIIRSRRKTIGLQVKDGEVFVRAPYWMTNAEIQSFVIKHASWIDKHLKESANRADIEPFSQEEIRELADKALEYIPARVKYYANLMGISYGRITIRCQRTRWGSCSQKGNLNFNCLLMLMPKEVTDSVIVHELAHRKYMNHSKEFYSLIREFYPEYDKWNSYLKKNGKNLIARIR